MRQQQRFQDRGTKHTQNTADDKANSHTFQAQRAQVPVVVQECDKGDRYEKVSNQDNCGIEIGIVGPEHDNSSDDKKYNANEQNSEPGRSPLRWILGWLHAGWGKIWLIHTHSPFSSRLSMSLLVHTNRAVRKYKGTSSKRKS